MLTKLFWICLAGAAGSGTRHLVSVWAAARFGGAFPYGTLIVNVVGCFLIGAVMQTAVNVASFHPTLRLVLATGFLGGLTTYSSFAFETVKLAQAGSRSTALMNFGLTSLACLVAVLLGLGAAQLWSAPPAR